MGSNRCIQHLMPGIMIGALILVMVIPAVAAGVPGHGRFSPQASGHHSLQEMKSSAGAGVTVTIGPAIPHDESRELSGKRVLRGIFPNASGYRRFPGAFSRNSSFIPRPTPAIQNTLTVNTTGTVTYVDLEGGFYGIIADDGTHYLPKNLPGLFMRDGLYVRFRGIIEPPAPNVRMWGTPVTLTAISADTRIIQGMGNVTHIDLEGGFYGIVMSDGQCLLPLNLPDEYRVDGLPVWVSATVAQNTVTIAQWGIPVRLTRIERAGTAPNPAEPLVIYTRTGGFGGFHDSLAIDPDGTVRIETRDLSTTLALDQEEIDALVTLFENAHFTTLASSYPPAENVADVFFYEIQYSGHRVSTADTAIPGPLEPIIASLNGIIASARDSSR